MQLTDRIAKIFKDTFDTNPLTSPARRRVNLLGEHVDYNDGSVLPAAIDRATYRLLPLDSASFHRSSC
ncbi:MAG: galactokinase family protein [Anaerolineales bacterium]